jgi:hypothetical protein
MRDLVPHLAQKFTNAAFSYLFLLRLLRLYAIREVVFIKTRGALFYHLDTAAEVDTVELKAALLCLVTLFDEGLLFLLT